MADAIEDPYDRRAPRPGRRHDVRHAVAVDVSHRDANAAGERPLVREEASVERARPEPRYERSDVRAAARARPGRGEDLTIHLEVVGPRSRTASLIRRQNGEVERSERRRHADHPARIQSHAWRKRAR